MIETEQGIDYVRIEGDADFDLSMYVLLGAGDDLLIGDPEVSYPEGSCRVEAIGCTGEDNVLNSPYFYYGLYQFESMDDE